MKDTIVGALKSKAGLTDEQANRAADVVMEVVQSKIPGAAGMMGGAVPAGLAGMAGGLGDMLGKK